MPSLMIAAFISLFMEEKAIEADLATFLIPTANPVQRGPIITPHPDNPDVQIVINGKVVDPNWRNPCPAGSMSSMGMSRRDHERDFGTGGLPALERMGAFDIPPDKPECAELRRKLADRRRSFLQEQWRGPSRPRPGR